MNIRDLRYVVAVAETGHFGRAAQRCYVSQPTLSGQIRKLEDELGITLFERTNRSVSITPIGESILQHARLILEQVDMIGQLAQAQRDPMAGSLRIGAIPTLSPYLMPLILAPLKRNYPQLRMILSEELPQLLLQKLRAHELDAVLMAGSEELEELAALPLFTEPFWLAHPRNHPLYYKEEITQSDLDSIELLLLSEGHCLAQQVMGVFRLQERPTNGEMGDLQAASLETLLQLVGAGYGCTLVPALAIRGPWMTDAGIIARKLQLQGASRQIILAYRPSFPRMAALEAFANIIRKHLPNTVQVCDLNRT